MLATDLQPWRCPSCRNLLAKVSLSAGSSVEIKCRCCNTYNVLRSVSEAGAALVVMATQTLYKQTS